MMNKEDIIQKVVKKVSSDLMKRGLIIEAGFAAMIHLWIPKDTPGDQVRALRTAFFAGAQHLFASIVATLDDDNDPTDEDLVRMDMLYKELEHWGKEFKAELDKKSRGKTN